MVSTTVVTVKDGALKDPNDLRQAATVQTEPGQPGLFSGITLNTRYFKSKPGILKLVQLAIGMICIPCTSLAWNGAFSFFLFVATTSFAASLLWTFVYLLSIREALKVPIDWILTLQELLNTGAETFLYVFASIVQLFMAIGGYFPPYAQSAEVIRGVFGIINSVAYAAGTYCLWLEWKNINPAQ